MNYIYVIENAIEDAVAKEIAFAVSKREDEIRNYLGLVKLVVNITTDSEIYKNEEIWCSKNYEGCNDYHIETLINGNMNGDPVFLAGFKPITDLL